MGRPTSSNAPPAPRILILLAVLAGAVAAAPGSEAPRAHEAETTVSSYGRDYDDCRSDWDVCSHASQCCSGTCLRHTCWSDPHRRPPCRKQSAHCIDSEDCCGALVCGRVGRHPHPVCREPSPTPPPPPDLCVRDAVNCSAGLALCQTPGTCDPATGTCSTPTNKTDNTACGTVGSCQTGICTTCTGQPSTVANVTWNCSATAPGGICTQSCACGSVGAANATCGTGGAWQAPLGSCRPPNVLLAYADDSTRARDVQGKLKGYGLFA